MIVAIATLAVALVVLCGVLVFVCVRVHERDGRERAMLLHAVLARSPGEFGKLQQQGRQPSKPSTADQRWAEDLRAHLALIGGDDVDVPPLVPEGL